MVFSVTETISTYHSVVAPNGSLMYPQLEFYFGCVYFYHCKHIFEYFPRPKYYLGYQHDSLILKTINMNQRLDPVDGYPPETTKLDLRIARAGGTSSRIEMQPHRLRETKSKPYSSTEQERDDLIRENGYLRQEIVFYQESRNAMLGFHSESLEAYRRLQGALKQLSEKLVNAEGRIERYWGMSLTGTAEKDMTVI